VIATTASFGVAACGGSSRPAPRFKVKTSKHVPPQDIGLLNRLLDLEHETIAAYEAGIPLLSEADQKVAEQFLRHELAHAGELAGLVTQAKGLPWQPRLRYSLGHPRTAAQTLDLLHRLERAQVSSYLWAIPRLAGATARAAAAAVLANDAQHVAMLRASLGQTPAPAAFVTGRE
jgi:ATP phosphoribosyltransferase regulatory subunit HisZ